MSNNNDIEAIDLLGVRIHSLSMNELNEYLVESIRDNKKCTLANVNIHAMNLAYENAWFRDFLNESAINFCDGEGVRLGAKMKGKKIREKITYNRWIWSLGELSQRLGLTWYLLGATEKSISKAVATLRGKYPELKIVGYHNGFVDSDSLPLILSEIKEKSPNILCLGMGMPLQEKFLIDHSDKINYNIALTGGAVFDYVSGEFKMTPDIYYRLKLEWFYRFINDPKRLFKRYFVGIPIFFLRLLFIKSRSKS
ncbi:WecB/TagA/CpsF family glycosyltransferase [Ekhidna sp.]